MHLRNTFYQLTFDILIYQNCFLFRTTQCTKCFDEEDKRKYHPELSSRDPVDFVPETSCEPSFVQKRLLALHPSGEKLFSEEFWFPSACSCQSSKTK